MDDLDTPLTPDEMALFLRLLRRQLRHVQNEEARRVVRELLTTPETHWGYGSGSVGCLFDNQGRAETREDAVHAALSIFQIDGDTDEECAALDAALSDARETLMHSPTYYFPTELRGRFGAGYVEVWEEDGPYSDEEG